MPKAKYIVYTDGGSRGNPGPAGAGVVICNEAGRILKKSQKPLGIQTNNFAEYQAVIFSLEELRKIVPKNKRPESLIEVRMDSELVSKQLNNEYEIKEEKLFPLFIKIHNLKISHFPKLVFKYLPRSKNKAADELANKAMNEQEQEQSKLRLF